MSSLHRPSHDHEAVNHVPVDLLRAFQVPGQILRGFFYARAVGFLAGLLLGPAQDRLDLYRVGAFSPDLAVPAKRAGERVRVVGLAEWLALTTR